MYIVLDQIIVGKNVKENVLKYLNKSRPTLDYNDPEIFDKMDIEEGTPSSAQLFDNRATQLINEQMFREPTRGGGIIMLDDIPTYISNPYVGEPSESISLKAVVTENQDIFVVSVEDDEDPDDEEYWMGIAYMGATYRFMEILDELGIDIKEAITGKLN